MEPLVNVVLVARTDATRLRAATEAALRQTHAALYVTIIDEGDSPRTSAAARALADDPRVVYLRLARPIGTAQARNLALAITRYDAVTFPALCDMPVRDKVAAQAAVLFGPAPRAEAAGWGALNVPAGTRLDRVAVLCEHLAILPDGGWQRCGSRFGLVADFFPNLAAPGVAEGPLAGPGLYRRGVFERLGGFRSGPGAEREFLGRLVMAGESVEIVERPLFSRPVAETEASIAARAETVRRIGSWRQGGGVPRVAMDFSGVELAEVSDAARLRLGGRALGRTARLSFAAQLDRLSARSAPRQIAAQ